MKFGGAHHTDAGSGQRIGRQVGGVMLFDIIPFKSRHESLAFHIAFGHEVVQDVGGMVQALFNINLAAFMLGRNVGHVPGDFNQLISAVVRLTNDGFVSFGNVMKF